MTHDEDGCFVPRDVPLRVDRKSGHTVFGTRSVAIERYKQLGSALWCRGSGKATLFYIDGKGKRRQRTWKRFTFAN